MSVPEDGQMLATLEGEGGPPNTEQIILLWGTSALLVVMAGLMSGLTIGLMAMDDMEMEVLMRSGTDTERKYATAIAPLLKNHHYLLSTLVLWNALSMEALPLFLDRLVSPFMAVILSVSVVLIFGEIVPQGICTRYGLAVGYYASWLLRPLMVIAFPIAYPLGKILDAVLGHSAPALPRGQLQQFVTLHGEDEGFARWGEALTQNETQVINSALELTSKTAKTAYTPLEKVFMLPSDAILDEELCGQILTMGHSRVPVHTPGDRRQIIGILLVKELLLVKEPTPVGKLKMRSVPALSAAMPMWDCLHLFKIGRAHMAVLCEATEQQKKENVGKLDKMGISEELYEGASSFNIGGANAAATEILRSHEQLTSLAAAGVKAETLQDMFINATIGTPIGILTMEDVVEELLGSEIIDETDRFVDNLKKKKINAQELSNSLPQKLRALLRMGVFTAAIRPGVRVQAGDSVVTPLLQAQAGTGSSGDQGALSPERSKSSRSEVEDLGGAGATVPLLGGLPPKPPSVVGGLKSPRKASHAAVVPEMTAVILDGSGTSRSAGADAENAPPSAEEVTSAIQKLEQHLDTPEISNALGTLQEAMDASVPKESGTATPKQRARARSALASTKRTASMQLRDKTLAGLPSTSPAGAVAEAGNCEGPDHASVVVGGLDATASGSTDQ